MAKKANAASFEEFLLAPDRLAKGAKVKKAKTTKTKACSTHSGQALPPHKIKSTPAPAKKEKVGLTIDPAIVEAIDDYIYRERKQGRRLKKNDVYEAALRQFLGLEGSDGQ